MLHNSPNHRLMRFQAADGSMQRVQEDYKNGVYE